MMAWLSKVSLPILLVWIICNIGDITALSAGAPSLACTSLMPAHLTTSPKPREESPFILMQSMRFYRKGQDVAVAIALTRDAPVNTTFRGFVIRAVDPETNGTIGSFVEGQGSRLVGAGCGDITHADSNDKEWAVLFWKPPADAPQKPDHSKAVQFYATVVQKYDTYYVGLPSITAPPFRRTPSHPQEVDTTEEHEDNPEDNIVPDAPSAEAVQS